jgi:hypothetical protein
MDQMEHENFKFINPFSALFAGPSQAGKTEFIYKLLDNYKTMIEPIPKQIIYCFSTWQPGFERLKNKLPDVKFHEGIIPTEQIVSDVQTLIILDDLMKESNKGEEIMDMFTRGSHHQNFGVILLTQNLFQKGPHTRTISLNSHYIVMFNNPRDKSQIYHLARQMYPTNSLFLVDAYTEVTKEPHSYLLLDLKQKTPENLRVQTNIFPEETRYCFVSK